MQLEQRNIKEINNRFQNLETKDDLLALINTAKGLLYSNTKNPMPIRNRSLTYYANPKLAKKRYSQFSIKKKSGGERTITAPVPQLKLIQRCINFILNVIFTPNVCVTGFVPGKSVVDNAKMHTGKHYVYNIDLKDFFPAVEFRRIKTVLELPPFNLKDEIAFLIANLCCYEGVLPQGAPTSPTITNIICQRLDRKLHRLAKRSGCSYTRYADDISFSSSHNIYKPYGKFLKEMKRIIKSENFVINNKKTRLQRSEYRQEVTGLVVNEKVNLNRRYIQRVRAMLHNWDKYGLEKAPVTFLKHYKTDKGHVEKTSGFKYNGLDISEEATRFIFVVKGKIDYMKMIRGVKDMLYLKYHDQFVGLLNHEIHGTPKNIDMGKVVDVWEKEGIEKAMEYYYQKAV